MRHDVFKEITIHDAYLELCEDAMNGWRKSTQEANSRSDNQETPRRL
jgi:hypothetical protein